MTYDEWNKERLQSKWHQIRIKKHGSWENYLKFASDRNRIGGLAGKGAKRPGSGRFKSGDLEARLAGKKGGDKRWGNHGKDTEV